MVFSEETLKQLQQQHQNEEYHLHFHSCLVASLALANDKKVEHLIDDDALELRNLRLPSSINKFIILFLPGGIELVLSTIRQDDSELQNSATAMEKIISSLHQDLHIDLLCSTNQTTAIPRYCLQEAPIMIATIIQNYWTLFKQINPEVNLQSPEMMNHFLITSKTYFKLMEEVILSNKFQTFLDRVAKTYTKQEEQQEAPAIITPPQKITYITNDNNNNEPSSKEPSSKEPSTKEPSRKKIRIYAGLSLFVPPSLATMPQHKPRRARDKKSSSATKTLSTTTVTEAKCQEVADNGAAAPKKEKRQVLSVTAVPEENCQEGKEKRAPALLLPDEKCQEPTQKNTEEHLQQGTASMLSTWSSEPLDECQALHEFLPRSFETLYDPNVSFPASSEGSLGYHHTNNFCLNNNLPLPLQGNLTLQNPSVQKLLT